MNKKLLFEIAGFFLLITLCLASYFLMYKKEKKILCEQDVMICADGSQVTRIAPTCEFATCNDVTYQTVPDVPQPEVDPTSIEPIATTSAPSSTIEASSEKEFFKKREPSFIEKVVNTITSVFSAPSPTQETTVNKTTQNQVGSPVNNSVISSENTPYNDTRYTVQNNNLINPQGQVVASLPGPTYSPPSSSESSWQTHTVNAIEVGSTTPVVDGIPVNGTEGKYYISENSFGNISLCEFSNRIYMYDIYTQEKILLYEENSTTLSHDDQRACNSEIFLLATEEDKLILKYHTINTNMICESTWSEPDKTWFLDVMSFGSGMSRYAITQERYTEAENKEIECRNNLEEPNN